MRFKRIYVEITNTCNLSCSFCSKGILPKRQMSEAEFTHVISQIRPFTDYIYLHVKGEPLSHPLLPRFLDICFENSIKVNLTTNGTLIDKLHDTLLEKPALRQVNFSLHSFETASKINIDSYLNNIIAFAKGSNEKNSTYNVFRFWNLDAQRKPDAAAKSMLETIQQSFNVSEVLTSLASERSIKLANRTFISFEEQFDWPSLDNPFVSNSGICYGARTMAAILADGTVVPCCLDADGIINLGNIFSQSFQSIIESQVFTDITRGFMDRKIVSSLCQHCSYRTKFDI